MGDIREQLAHLVYPGFVVSTPWEWLVEYPRYLKAIALRLDKLAGAMGRDRQCCIEFKPLWQAYLDRQGKQGGGGEVPELISYRWQLEELRVSLFAQELKTKMPVSVKRLQAFLSGIKL